MMTLTISIFQSALRNESPDARLSWLDMAAERAAASGADILVCPGLFVTGPGRGDDVADLARPARGEYTERVGEIAFLHEIAVVFGFPEAGDGGYFDSVVFVSATGDSQGCQRAAHLTQAAQQAGLSATGGTPRAATTVEYAGWKIAMLSGADLAFPEAARHAALGGAEVLIAPATCQESDGFVADKVAPVRAYENGVYLAFANWSGQSGGVNYPGNSRIIAPSGKVEAAAGSAATILMAKLEKSALSQARSARPYLDRRRGFGD